MSGSLVHNDHGIAETGLLVGQSLHDRHPIIARNTSNLRAVNQGAADTAPVAATDMDYIDGISIDKTRYDCDKLCRADVHLVGHNAYHTDAEWDTYVAVWARDKWNVGPLKVYNPVASFGTDMHDAATIIRISEQFIAACFHHFLSFCVENAKTGICLLLQEAVVHISRFSKLNIESTQVSWPNFALYSTRDRRSIRKAY